MARYWQIHKRIWKDEWFMDLDPIHKLFYIYLFSNERTAIAGIYELPKKVMQFESGLTTGEIDEAFAIFVDDGKAWFDNGVVFIPNVRKYHETDHANCKKGIENDLKGVKDCPLKALYYHRYSLEESYDGVSTPFEGPYKGVNSVLGGPCKAPINLNLNSNLNLKGGVGGNENVKAAVIGALCNVCSNAGVTDRDTLDMADDLVGAGRDDAWVYAFAKWYAGWGNGKMYLNHIRTFGDDFDAKQTPAFAKKNQDGHSSQHVENVSGAI